MIEQLDLQILTAEECPQGSDAWHAARAGVPTASAFSSILAKGQGKTRRAYLYKLGAERLTGEVVQIWGGNAHTERGHEQEPEARALYAFMRNVEPQQVGFMRRGPVGCSPDSLIGDAGLLEIKTRLPHLQLEVLENGVLPPEHKAQVQGQLWVSGREWCDYCSYAPKLPPFIIRVHREPIYIAELAKAVKVFCDELDALIKRLSKMQVAA